MTPGGLSLPIWAREAVSSPPLGPAHVHSDGPVCFLGTPPPTPALPQAPPGPPGFCEGAPRRSRRTLASSQQARGSWNSEQSLACVCCIPPAGAPPLTRGQEFLPLAPNKSPGKEELWEGAGNILEVGTEWGVGREPWPVDTQGRTGRWRGESGCG